MDASSQSPPPAAGTFAGERARAFAFLARRERFHPAEALPWLLAIAAFFLFPNQMTLGSQTLIMVLFALSLDLILGYAGIVTLGHAAYFGVGAYAAALLITSVGWTEPISGLVCATIVAAIAGLFSGLVLLRYRGLALLVLTLSTTIMLQQLGNLFRDFTGGLTAFRASTSRRCSDISTTTSTATPITFIALAFCWSCSSACAGSSIRRSVRRWSASAKMSDACTRSARRCTGGW